ncbi:MAG: hypothetical protein ACXWQ5_19610, partial [Ktedonobacterales bacterium]
MLQSSTDWRAVETAPKGSAALRHKVRLRGLGSGKVVCGGFYITSVMVPCGFTSETELYAAA